MDPLKIPIRASTQEHLEVEDIQNDIALLKDGSCSLILETTAINFGLLSEKEQEATIYAYAALLNSLTFPIQIVIHSKKKDVSSYLKLLDEVTTKQANPLLKQQMVKYRQFIEETVRKSNVLDKNFFVVIPFSILELGAARTAGSFIKRKKGLPYPKDYIFEQAKVNLYPKRDQLIKQLTRLGLKTHALASQELIELFYSFYNPGLAEVKNTQEYTAPMIGSNLK